MEQNRCSEEDRVTQRAIRAACHNGVQNCFSCMDWVCVDNHNAHAPEEVLRCRAYGNAPDPTRCARCGYTTCREKGWC